MPVDGGSSSPLDGVVGRKGSTPVHSAWSRELYLSAATSFTVGRSRKENYLAPRWVQVGRNAFTFIKRHSLAPKAIWLGPRSQILDRIGQTDMMVYRGGSVPSGDAGHCRPPSSFARPR